MKDGKPLLIVGAVALVAMVLSAWALGAIFGPTDSGMRCERSAASRACQLSRTTFLGFAGNSAFSIPESAIRGAAAECAKNGVGRSRGSSCAVYLTLDSGERQIVSSYALMPEAESAARRINDYLRDGTAREVVIDESMLTPVLLYAVLPVVIVVGALVAGRWWRSRSAPAMR